MYKEKFISAAGEEKLRYYRFYKEEKLFIFVCFSGTIKSKELRLSDEYRKW
jgi:hypothetical protein